MPRKAHVYEPLPSPQESNADLLADGVLKMADAARFCGVCVRTLSDLAREGKIKSFFAGKNRVIPKKALVAYLANLMQEQR